MLRFRQDRDVVTLYVRAGYDNIKYGACPFCQRVFMLLMLKAETSELLKFRVATVPQGRIPEEFRRHGLRNLPAIIHRDNGIDTVEEIVDYINDKFPSTNYTVMNDVDKLVRNFFSRFCFYIKSVSKDASAMECDLKKMDFHLRKMDTRFIFGDELSPLDCEILPKLHHLRVASACLKNYQLPPEFVGIWRYLNNAYNNDIFQKACPPDQEIVLHWASRPDTFSLSYAARYVLTRHTPRFSFDVPAVAIPITL